MLGFFSRYAAISWVVLLFIYFLCNPPLTGLEYSVPSEGNNLIVNRTLIESNALVAIAAISPIYGFWAEYVIYILKEDINKVHFNGIFEE